MNKIVIEITKCQDCKYCEHNGLLQANPKYVCTHNKMYISKQHKKFAEVNGIKYYFGEPIVRDYTDKNITIPNWCPRLS